ncbi:hypothetical protein [Streptomyces ossamyceticus]|uniref:hypothetical protein n=1 Tax=Streptomyces ossamyceticus TaxID=249581 RepID=UPI003436284E
MPRLPFTPLKDGFAFGNDFVNHVIRVPMLGVDVTTRGRCGGMAFTALDLWHHRITTSTSSRRPDDGSLLGDYLYWRLIDSMVANGFKFLHFMRTPDHPTWFNGIGVARATREEEYPRLKSVIDSGRPCPVGLCQARGLGGLSGDHQVVAYGYEDGDPYSRVFVYDVNHPGVEHTLEFTSAYDPGEREVRENNGAVWRGFFVESYAPQLPVFLAEGRLLSDRSDPAVHVVRGGGRFHVPSPQEFDANGFQWHEVVEAQDGSMEHVSAHPADRMLVRERSRSTVHVVHGGRAFAVPSPEVLAALGLDLATLCIVPDGSLGAIEAAVPREGTLLRELDDPRVHTVRAGVLRHVPSLEAFHANGFVWDNVGVVPQGALAKLPMGDPVPDSGHGSSPIARSWAERRSGTILTSDGDRIHYTVVPGQPGDGAVEFVLELGAALTWRKELVLRDGAGASWTIGVQDAQRSDRNGLYRDQLPGGSLLFRKMKGLGVMWDVHSLGSLDQLPDGARVTFHWHND